MATIAFLPWARLTRALAINGHFQVIPIDVDSNPLSPNFEAEWETVRQILSSYHEPSGKPLREAALLLFHGFSMGDDFNDDQLGRAFVYRDILCTAALSARECFGYDYFNSDNLRLVVQRIDKDGRGAPTIVSRRRDGSQTSAFAPGIFRDSRPFHVGKSLIGFDLELAEGLIKAFEAGGDDWQEIADAIQNFNGANTDSPEIALRQEAVMTVAAMERVLGSDHTERQLAIKFVAALAILKEAPSKSGRRQRNAELSGFQSTRETWLRDFFRLRNPYAHGRTQPQYQSIWSTEEHLLLASFIFPVLLKIRLQSMGHYVMKDEDLRRVFSFDQLLGLRDTHAEGRDGEHTYAWVDVISDACWDWQSERDDLIP